MVFIEHNSLKSDIFLIPYLFHVFQDSCFQGPGFSGFRFLRVQVFQGPGPGFRSSHQFWFEFKFESRQRGLCLVRIVDQTQNFQGMFQVLCCTFILINKEEGSPKQSRS